ncbi:MAG: hypothetical protein JNM25_07715 [Planctomycetes bacterium]|nr:hypothetical protein [Planctomycetota bacterium]
MLALLAACSGGGGGGAPNVPPTIVTAAFVGGGGSPVAGDTLLLFFSEDISTVSGALLTDADVALSGSATLGSVTAAPSQTGARSVSVTLGAGVTFTPGATTIALAAGNDVVRDTAGALGNGGAPTVIGSSDGAAPVLGAVTIAAIDAALNGTGPAGGTLQVPPNGWTLDLAFTDNGPMDAARTQITASVAVGTASGSQPAGSNLLPFLTPVTTGNTAASYRVPATTTFPNGPVTLTCTVVDASGLASNQLSFAATVRTFSNELRPFETNVNSQQVWYLDFSRDVESFTTSSITNGVSVDVVAGANGRSDFDDLLLVLGLNNASPIANVDNGMDSNQVVAARFRQQMLTTLAALFGGTNVVFTTTQPAGSFGGNSSVPYDQLGFSQISIAGSSSTTGVLGIAIFDPSNATQNDDTRTDFQGERLGVFLHTIADAGMGPPASSAFRMTFGPLAPSLGGVPIGNDAFDGQRLLGTTNDARATILLAAIDDLARFTAVVAAHESGHSMGLVRNGAMPNGLYGNDSTNFPGSTDGHIRTPLLFPAGATNVMSPALSYSSATNAATAFNRLNLAYLREQVFYGN